MDLNTSQPQKQTIPNITVKEVDHKTSEFKAAEYYTKHNIICGIEYWLKEEIIGKVSTKDAIKFSEVFPKDYTAYKNDKGLLGCIVFKLIHKDIILVKLHNLVTNCEMKCVKIHLKAKKELPIGCVSKEDLNRNKFQVVNVDDYSDISEDEFDFDEISNQSTSKNVSSGDVDNDVASEKQEINVDLDSIASAEDFSVTTCKTDFLTMGY
ncbi:purB [Mytilus coruscus]|uniref:PurB n=1 Tax=Mytilus coruscus TaxID=42192 RepID=A0A6J8BIQ9_MYTCO|nr:purB [Mytilus coruscus]